MSHIRPSALRGAPRRLSTMASDEKKAPKEKKEKRDKKDKKDKKEKGSSGDGKAKRSPGKGSGGGGGTPIQPVGKAKRKANFVSWFSDALKNDEGGARSAFIKARDYVAVANVFRARARDPSVAGAHDEALKLLDSKGHFMHIVDQCASAHAEAAKSWEEVKRRQRAKFEKAGGADGIAEKKRAAREAKEQHKLMLAAREERESRAKALKTARKEYKAQMNVFRMRGSCLDWCNLGKCSFGSECQFKHDEEDKGSLVALAAKVKAANVGGRTGEKDERRATKIREAREAREAAGDAGDAGDVETGSRKKKTSSLLGDLSDDSDDDDDSDSDDEGAERKRAKKKVLSVLPGDDGDDSSDDEGVPRIVRARLAQRREDEREAKASRERRREEKARGEERARAKQTASGGNGRATAGGEKSRGGGGSARRFEKRRASFGDGEKKKKKPRHPDGRHALNAAATAAGKGRPRTKFDD